MAGNETTINRLPKIFEVQDTVTRPANTTAYTVGDAISDNATTATAAGYFALDLKTSAQGYGSVLFTDFTMHRSSNTVANAAIDVMLFTTAPAFAGFEDNAAIAITDAEMLECKGVVQFAAGTSTDGSAGWTNMITGCVQTTSKNIGVVLAENSSIVYGIAVASGGFTPASGEIFGLTAHAYIY